MCISDWISDVCSSDLIGYQNSLVVGLMVMGAGALMMIPAARIPSYGVVLTALFVVASGITLLQVAANPYVAVIGSPETASSRLNLVQAFNSMGTTLAPLFGGYLILSRSTSGTRLDGAAEMPIAERRARSEEHTSELQSLMRSSYAVFCLNKKNNK